MLKLLEIPKDILVFEKYPILNQMWGIVSTEYAKDATQKIKIINTKKNYLYII